MTGLFLLQSCQKDLDEYVLDPNYQYPDTTWYNTVASWMPVNSLISNLSIPLQSDSFMINAGAVTSHSFANSLQLIAQAGSLTDSLQQPYFGRVVCHTQLLTRKGDLIRNGITTIDEEHYLIGAGVVLLDLRASDNQQPLFVNVNGSLVLQYDYVSAQSPSLTLYKGVADQGSINWNRTADSFYNQASVSNNRVYIQTNQTGWIAAAHELVSNNQNNSKISVTLPSNYTNANTLVYLVSEEENTVMRLQPEIASHRFVSSALPAGKNIKVIVMSKQGNDYFKGEAVATTIAQGTGNYQQIQVFPVITSFQNLLNYLRTL